MTRARLLDILRWAVAIISVAVVLACASRVVSWILGEAGEGQNVWPAAVGLVLLATTGGVALTGLSKDEE